MKYAVYTILLSLLVSCTHQADKGKKFFDYDRIDHYQSDFDEKDIGKLSKMEGNSVEDLIKNGVLLGSTPKDISDTSFIDYLEKIGFKKEKLSNSKFKGIDSIFSEKHVDGIESAACIYVYRDILIFRKQGKVIGTAKICFGCGANEIQGTQASTASFGQGKDYDNLHRLIRAK